MNHILTVKEGFTVGAQLLEFKGQGSKDCITLSLSNFLFGKAQDNYVEINYIEKEKPARFIMRSSLSNQVESVKNQFIIRCHRSYMVNLLKVSAVKGNNQYITLIIEPFDMAIPVSKSYKKETLRKLHEIKNFV